MLEAYLGLSGNPRPGTYAYADYSHGIRLVRSRVFVDGQPTTIAPVLADLVRRPLLSDEARSPQRPTP